MESDVSVEKTNILCSIDRESLLRVHRMLKAPGKESSGFHYWETHVNFSSRARKEKKHSYLKYASMLDFF